MNQSTRSGPPVMTSQPWALTGIALITIGALLFENRDEDPDIFMAAAAICIATGLYLVLVGAIARGVEIAGTRRWRSGNLPWASPLPSPDDVAGEEKHERGAEPRPAR